MPAPLRVLRGQFGLFYAGNGLSLVGSWMQRIACSWLVWEWTGSAFWLGVLAAGDLLPVVVVGPFAGVAADRWDRLLQNRIAQALSAGLASAMAILLYFEMLNLYGLIALVTAQGTLVASIQPARLAMVQQMVAREDTGTAVALNSVNVNLARLLGPAAAGALILKIEIYWIFVLNAAVTLLFVFLLSRIRLAPNGLRNSSAGFSTLMMEGLRYVWRAGALRLVLLLLLAGGIIVRSMLELVPAIAASVFENTAVGLAVLTGSAAAGAVAAGLTVGRSSVGHLFRGALLWWALGAISAIVLTQTVHDLVAVASAAVMGAAITRSLVGTQTFVQLTTPERLRGRVLSIHGLIARGSPALGALAVGFASDRFGLSISVAASCCVFLVALIFLTPLVLRFARTVSEAG